MHTAHDTEEKWLTGTITEKSARRISFIASHEREDRDGDVILISGIDTTDFMRNPLLMRQHDKTQAIGTVEFLRKTSIDGYPALVGEASFPDRPLSLDTLADIQAGLLNAVSIGFLGLERGAPLRASQRGATFTKTTLLEISVVTLPSCATCLITSKGISKCASCSTTQRCDDEDILDGIKSPSRDDEDILAGIVLPTRDDRPDVLDLDDESEHIFQSTATVKRIIREVTLAAVRAQLPIAINREFRRMQGRLD